MSQLMSLREQMNISYRRPDPAEMKRFISELAKNQQALDYLYGRGFSDKTIEHFNLGYDPDRNAISIPVFKKKELINIRYRFLGESKAKYTQETNCEVWVYNDDGFEQARQQGWLLIVEGEFDLMSCWQAGFKNVISPASGKDSYMKWIELVDAIPNVSIAYDNDKPGKESALKLAERIGVEKCKEVVYPHGYNDANEYFTKNISEDPKKDFFQIIKDSGYFYKYTFTGIGDIMKDMFESPKQTIKLETIPHVEFEQDWIVIMSGDSGTGKTSHVLNVAKELSDKGLPTLIFPYERGIASVGKRYIQILFEKHASEFVNASLTNDDKQKMMLRVADQEVYFALPEKEKMVETIRKAKRIFGIKFVIIDHLDYMVRQSGGNYNQDVGNAMQEYKKLAQQEGINFIIVHHINKPMNGASKTRRPRKEDLKGSSSIYQDAEAVVMLYREDEHSHDIEAIVVKNKGEHGYKKFDFNPATGVMKPVGKDETGSPEDSAFKDFGL